MKNWREYLHQEELEEGLLDFFKQKEEEPAEEVVPPTPPAYIKSLRSAESRRLPARSWKTSAETNIPYNNWLQDKHTPWMLELEKSADNGTLSLNTAREIASQLLLPYWRGHQNSINQEAIDLARERIKDDFNKLFIRLGAARGGLSVIPPEGTEGALSMAAPGKKAALSLTENWRKYIAEEGKRKVNIFLDMDGVLVAFPSALKVYIKNIYSMDPNELHPNSKSSRRTLRRLQNLQLNDEEIDDLYDRSEYKFQSGEDYKPDEKNYEQVCA